MALLERLNRAGMTILMVTHAPELGAHAERIIHLRDGKVLREEDVKERRNAADELAMLGDEDL